MHLAALLAPRSFRLPLTAAVAVALAAPLGSAAFAADGSALDLPPLHVVLPAGYTFDTHEQPVTGTGPNDERVTVTVTTRPAAAPSDPAQLSAEESARQFADGPMSGIASRGDRKVLRPLARFPTQDGKAAYSVVSEWSTGMFSKSHLVQYLFASADTVVYFSFEGPGAADPVVKQLDAALQNQRWDQ